MRKSTVVLLMAVLSAGGYLAGRAHLAGRVRYGLTDLLNPPPDPVEPTIPDPPVAYDAAAVFRALDGRLDARLDSLAAAHAMLGEYAGSDAARRAFLADSMRGKLREGLPPWDGPPIDLQPQTFPWFVQDGVQVDLVRMTVPPGAEAWCVLARPTGADGPGPAVLFLHGSRGSPEDLVSDMDYHHGVVLDLARRGYVVAAPIVASSTPRDRMALHIRALHAGWTGSRVEHWQALAALDYLMTVPGVDTSRIGLYGISIGGGSALRLAAMDPRPRAVIVSGNLVERTTWWFGDTLEISHVGAMPRQPEFLDDANLVALIHPRPLAFETGRSDPRYPSTVRLFQKLEALYHATGDEDRIALLDFDGGHETSIAGSGPFLDRWLTPRR